ncbi:MAG: DUF126 domain-containing protein [Desulfurococcaceae archaeon]
MFAEQAIKVKTVVPGYCRGEPVLLNRYISFFGEVNPETGCLVGENNVCLPGKVLVFKGTRGSTVGPYIIYALKKNSKGPVCMIVEDLEPMLVAGCVLAEIPLYSTESIEALINLSPHNCIEVKGVELRACEHQ